MFCSTLRTHSFLAGKGDVVSRAELPVAVSDRAKLVFVVGSPEADCMAGAWAGSELLLRRGAMS